MGYPGTISQGMPFPGMGEPMAMPLSGYPWQMQQFPQNFVYPQHQQYGGKNSSAASQAMPQQVTMTGGAVGSQAHGIRANVTQLAGCADAQTSQDIAASGLRESDPSLPSFVRIQYSVQLCSCAFAAGHLKLRREDECARRIPQRGSKEVSSLPHTQLSTEDFNSFLKASI